MIEGINYYPQKKKSKGILKWWIIVPQQIKTTI